MIFYTLTAMKCSNEREGFFTMVVRKYGEEYKRSLKDWIKNKYKICLVKQQRKFLIRCRSFDVVPQHIYKMKFSAMIQDIRLNAKYRNLKTNFQRKLLNLEIKNIHSQLRFLMRKLERVEEFLDAKLPTDLLTNFFESNKNRIQNYNNEIKMKLINKFDRIRTQQNSFYDNFFKIDMSKWVINVCSKKIPEHVIKIVGLGDRFGVPINFNDSKDRLDIALDVIKNFEASSFKFPERLVDKVRSMVVNSLRCNLYSNKHLNYFDTHIHNEFVKCKKFLKNNQDIFVTKADKGQVTVIMDRAIYNDQMFRILDDADTYKSLKNNPLRKITTKCDNLLKAWRDSGIIDDKTYKSLKCTNGNLPRCYGLPKIHKPGHPLRIVVSSVGSPLYDIAKFLHGILSGSIKKPHSHVKDGWSFAATIKGTTIEPHETLVSLDVTALFTNIPKELVMQGVADRWNNIQKNTRLSLEQLLLALDMILCSTSFTFEGRIYEQIYGSPMGSPLSPILADLVMEDLETYCLSRLDFNVHTFHRYVDDIFMIIPAEKLNSVLTTFNSYHPRLKFTYELEKNNKLNFLNTSVIRENGNIITNWFRKPTFSGRYINFYSNHPTQYKVNTVTNLVDQAILLSDERFHLTNLDIVKTILLNNGYPLTMLNRLIVKRHKYLKNKIMEGFTTSNDQLDNRSFTLTVPYTGRLSNDIRRIVKNFVDVRFSIPKKLDTVIRKGKDKLDDCRRTEVVYQIECRDCDQVYIGQTKRHLETRVKEHKNNIKNPAGNFSVVTNHRISLQHEFDWDKTRILHNERNRKKREIAEMFFIKKQGNNINLQKDTDNLNSIYDQIITLD